MWGSKDVEGIVIVEPLRGDALRVPLRFVQSYEVSCSLYLFPLQLAEYGPNRIFIMLFNLPVKERREQSILQISSTSWTTLRTISRSGLMRLQRTACKMERFLRLQSSFSSTQLLQQVIAPGADIMTQWAQITQVFGQNGNLFDPKVMPRSDTRYPQQTVCCPFQDLYPG